ncbi:MAG: cation transporter [Planctomycetota bacterium]|nr:MAG: cation transporter [Planctomycetota bacterium]
MHTENLDAWKHEHVFGQDEVAPGERRTLVVALLTASFMVVEIAGGLLYGSMALLADGLHMGSHAVALGIAVLAYVYARRRARDARFSFGSGKVNALGGFAGALLLAVFALLMAWESVERVLFPTPIAFDQAIAVAVLGLLVNGISVFVLGAHDHDHDHDHNLRSATLHVFADALTSLTAIVALLAGKFWGANWLDPVMGIVGALLVARWSLGLLRETASVLLDFQAPEQVRREVREAIEGDDDRVSDLHVWSIGPGVRAACISVVSHRPQSPDAYRRRLPARLGLRHVTVEVHRCPGSPPRATAA